MTFKTLEGSSTSQGARPASTGLWASTVAARMARSTVHVYDCGHFEPYVQPHFATTVADQLAFLAAHVPAELTAETPVVPDPGASA